eukprot:3729188-Lingulodinium_polyedra.AAC.1
MALPLFSCAWGHVASTVRVRMLAGRGGAALAGGRAGFTPFFSSKTKTPNHRVRQKDTAMGDLACH